MRWPRPAFLRKIFVFVLWACDGDAGSTRDDERRSGAGVDHHGAAAGLDLGPAERELVRHGHDLVRHDDGDLEGLGELLELAEVRVQRLLALRELAAARELRAEVRHDAVDDDEAVLALARLRELARGVLEALALLLEVRGPGGGDVVEALVRVDARGLGDLDEALRAEGVVGVDEEHAARGAAVLLGELGLDAERERQLRLARAGVAEDFGDRPDLNPPADERVEGRRARRMNSDAFGRGREASKVLAMDKADWPDELEFLGDFLDDAVADARATASPTPSTTFTPTTPTTPATPTTPTSTSP